MNRDELIEQAEVWYRKQDYSPDFPLFKIMADFVLSETPAIQKVAVGEFLATVQSRCDYLKAGDMWHQKTGKLYSQAVQEIYAEMFGGEGDDDTK